MNFLYSQGQDLYVRGHVKITITIHKVSCCKKWKLCKCENFRSRCCKGNTRPLPQYGPLFPEYSRVFHGIHCKWTKRWKLDFPTFFSTIFPKCLPCYGRAKTSNVFQLSLRLSQVWIVVGVICAQLQAFFCLTKHGGNGVNLLSKHHFRPVSRLTFALFGR